MAKAKAVKAVKVSTGKAAEREMVTGGTWGRPISTVFAPGTLEPGDGVEVTRRHSDTCDPKSCKVKELHGPTSHEVVRYVVAQGESDEHGEWTRFLPVQREREARERSVKTSTKAVLNGTNARIDALESQLTAILAAVTRK